MKSYLAVMWLGPRDERGIFVKGTSEEDVAEMIRKRRWKGTLVNIIPIIEPGHPVYQQITGNHLKVIEGGDK